MKRDLEKELIRWKNSKERKPIIIRGMRQVGKTWLVREFAKSHFDSYEEINFEQSPELKSCFIKPDPAEILKLLQLNLEKNIVPGKTLLFLDEIQDCPQAILSFRYFFEQMPQLHIIGAGSLLEFTFNSDDFRMPVGRIDFLCLHPVSFGEFLEASGRRQLREYCQNVNPAEAVDNALEQKLSGLVADYCLCGGMPRAARAMVEDHDIELVNREQLSIIQTYRRDFGKYAKRISSELMEKVFSSMPGMVGKKYKYVEVDENARAADIRKALTMMEKAGIMNRVFSTSGAGLPLSMHKKENVFKVLFADVGLMQRMLGISAEIYMGKNLLDVYRGSVAEQYVGQQLLALLPPYSDEGLFYWHRDKLNSQAEVDYLWQFDSHIIPVEVKSGKTGRLRSLHQFFIEYKPPLAIKISRNPHNFQDNILSVPLWGIEGLDRLLKRYLVA